MSVNETISNNGGRQWLNSHTRLVSFLDGLLTDQWDVTMRIIVNGQALYEKVTEYSGLMSFGRALNNYSDLSNLEEPEKKKLCKMISIVKGIYEKWSSDKSDP